MTSTVTAGGHQPYLPPPPAHCLLPPRSRSWATSSTTSPPASEPQSPKWFHSGRNYGTYSAARRRRRPAAARRRRWRPRVGSFGDDLCNVGRLPRGARVELAGQPATRKLAWSTYFSFSSTIFETYDPVYADDPMADVARLADAVDGCIHRFGDSRTVMDGKEVLLGQLLRHGRPRRPPASTSSSPSISRPPGPTPRLDAWYGCFAKNQKASGKWGMQVVDERTGQRPHRQPADLRTGLERPAAPRRGRLPRRVPPAHHPVGPQRRRPRHLASPGARRRPRQSRGTFPVAGRPKLQQRAPTGAQGVGSYTAFAELTLHPGDPAGVELDDGTIVAHDPDGDSWIVR